MPAWAGRTGADAEINVNHVLLPVLAMAAASATAEADVRRLELIEVSADGTQFVGAQTGRRFLAWGCNYDHDESGRLLDDYWVDEWERVEEDFAEMQELGANLVRVHLQLGRFMRTPDQPDPTALGQLERLLRLSEQMRLYLDITGLGCYHKQDTPEWYDSLAEDQRWAVQARFWEAIAETCATSDAVFCYDLMNEPILPGAGTVETEWLAGEFGGKHFVQRLTLDLAGRAREQVAKAWVEALVSAIRRHDRRHMVTVGVIPWALPFPKAKPLFYSPSVCAMLDFVSVHFYPKTGEVDRALEALAVYAIGKPLVIEEIFPLSCSADDVLEFIDRSKPIADGWVSFYWGKTAEEYAQEEGLPAAIKSEWLTRFRGKGAEVLQRGGRDHD